MSDQSHVNPAPHQSEGAERRRQLRALLLSAADAARQGRHLPQMAARMTRPVGRAIRDRISMLVRAAG